MGLNYVFQVFLFLILLGAVLFLSFIVTRYIGNKANKVMKGKYISVVETLSLGMDKHLYLIKAGDRFLLVASSGKQIEMLTPVQIEDFNAEDIRKNAGQFDFKTIFDKYMQSFRNRKGTAGNRSTADANTNANANENLMDSLKDDTFKNNLGRLRTITTRLGGQERKDGDKDTNEKRESNP